jgi:mannose-6-phosphate isomerase-like protein (cupin superfamily)
MRYLRHGNLPPSPDWFKSRMTNDLVLYNLATRPHLIEILSPLLGDDIILWGTHLVKRGPGAIHPWHVDIESAAPDERFVSLWIGVENTSRESSLRFVSRSHAIGITIQQLEAENGYKRGEATDETLLGWARERDPDAAIIEPDPSDGEALIFDGRLWHGSNNQRSEGARTALLLQYAAARSPVFAVDLGHLKWPFRLIDNPRPPVIAVTGHGDSIKNQVVPPPTHQQPEAFVLGETISPVALPLEENQESGWKPHHLFCGKTYSADRLSCHVSVLSPGHCPHPPHAHLEEEILIPLEGDAEIVTADDADGSGAETRVLTPGSLAFYPAFSHHTIRNSSDAPITYLMFKWQGSLSETEAPQSPQFQDYGEFVAQRHAKPFHPQRVAEFPTNYLSKLHFHVTDLQAGAGYSPHEDAYDVAILVLAGKAETLGRIVEPHGVIFYPANVPHGMRNPGDQPSRYLVIEFHRYTSTSDSLQNV